MLQTTNQADRLSVDEECELARRWQSSGDKEALRRMVETHLGLVVNIAMSFRSSGPPVEDLIQEGHVGLLVAARRFDPARGARLATYATYWIRAFVMGHIVRSHGPVRIGTTQGQLRIFFRLSRARRHLEEEGRDTDAASLATELGVRLEELESMLPRLRRGDILLDAPISSEDDSRGEGRSLKQEGPTPEDLVADLEEDVWQKDRLRDGLRALDPRERTIIRARYLRATSKTLEELAQEFGISRERVRQLEERAMMKLRTHCCK